MSQLTILGLGAMGAALAARAAVTGHHVTAWNRSPRPTPSGVTRLTALDEAVRASPLVVACLLDAASVREALCHVDLEGRAIVNLTTTTPKQARALSAWVEARGGMYLDGGIMAVPEMIGGPSARVLYSGAPELFERHRRLLDTWAESEFLGPDPGRASLVDLAMLSGMYAMFGGFLHGAAMVATDGIAAPVFAARQAPFLAAMTGAFAGFAETIERRAWDAPGQQSLSFSDLGHLLEASEDQGVPPRLLAPLQTIIRALIAEGHGSSGFARAYEGMAR